MGLGSYVMAKSLEAAMAPALLVNQAVLGIRIKAIWAVIQGCITRMEKKMATTIL